MEQQMIDLKKEPNYLLTYDEHMNSAVVPMMKRLILSTDVRKIDANRR